jgi:hypothetical protein
MSMPSTWTVGDPWHASRVASSSDSTRTVSTSAFSECPRTHFATISSVRSPCPQPEDMRSRVLITAVGENSARTVRRRSASSRRLPGSHPRDANRHGRWFLACSEPGAAQVAGWDDHPSDRVGRGRDRARPLYCYPLESTDDAPEMSTLPTTPDPLAPAYVVVGPAGRKAPCTGPPNSKPRTVNTPDARPAPRKSMTVNA